MKIKTKLLMTSQKTSFLYRFPHSLMKHILDIHSLAGCQGELVNEDLEVQIENSSGEVILDEKQQTEANGFLDLWLPRDDTFNVTITQDGKKTTSEISTFDGDN